MSEITPSCETCDHHWYAMSPEQYCRGCKKEGFYTHWLPDGLLLAKQGPHLPSRQCVGVEQAAIQCEGCFYLHEEYCQYFMRSCEEVRRGD